METTVKIKLSTGKEIDLTLDEFEELKGRFEKVEYVTIPTYPTYPTVPQQPSYPIITYYSGTTVPNSSN
jgi:hypothetical protein